MIGSDAPAGASCHGDDAWPRKLMAVPAHPRLSHMSTHAAPERRDCPRYHAHLLYVEDPRNKAPSSSFFPKTC
ncbi:hypothetical protein GEV33_005909 [Tenebrio molitor]|uniref:Uncharacterized protein n=1 Tax=Tenebrio molitor TaxID=7067 RepID=A0A8J6HM96_TENMO|nr:hypothetical protein GEV33_005909 [Tenebrio molitor]